MRRHNWSFGVALRNADPEVSTLGHAAGYLAASSIPHAGRVRVEKVNMSTIASLRQLGLVSPTEEPTLTPLTGGVASDIWLVQAGMRTFVVKRALPKLRVAASWQVPISRNAAEVQWLRSTAKVVPDAVPVVLGHDPACGLFAMSYLSPASYPVWKAELREQRIDPAFAAKVGAILANIHGANAGSTVVADAFSNDELFHAIRLEPYFEATADKHPRAAGSLFELSRDTLRTKHTLVHGDVSPKNILVGPKGPVFLDAESAWYGDPAFDLAFCLNHLLLKCLWVPAAAEGYLTCFDELAAAYLAGVSWEAVPQLEARAARLLPALLLGRIDGKSPVEYLNDEPAKAMARAFALPMVAQPLARLSGMRTAWASILNKQALRAP